MSTHEEPGFAPLTTRGHTSHATEPIDLSELVREMIDRIEGAIGKKRLCLNYNLASHLPLVTADVEQLSQVVTNLVINASEAVGDNGGLVSITTDFELYCSREQPSNTVNGGPLSPGRYACLEVADTGCGIDEETRPKIFDPFFTTKCTGRGLGLTTALEVVRAHKGAIDVVSDPGCWSSVKVLLPCHELVRIPVRSHQAPFAVVRKAEACPVFVPAPRPAVGAGDTPFPLPVRPIDVPGLDQGPMAESMPLRYRFS